MAFARQLLEKISKFSSSVDVVVCPTYVSIAPVQDVLAGTSIKVGAQNMWPEVKGAFTGEISPTMLTDLGLDYVVLGHSERRKYFEESNEFINKKLRTALEHELQPIFCIGEVLEEREQSKTFDVLKKQLNEGLKDISRDEIKDIVIAYEPVWAIGTGKVATTEQAQEAIKFIRDQVRDLYDDEIADNIMILYGGSIKPQNFTGLLAQPDIDGGLVGGASLKESFVELVNIAVKMTD